MEGILPVMRGMVGVAVLLGMAWILSADRRAVNWRTVGLGVVLQLAFALLVLRIEWFRELVSAAGSGFVAVLGFTQEGARFVFGDLAESEKFGFVFCFQVLPIIVFFSALTSVLYYLGVLQRIVFGLAWVMTRAMRLSGAESLAAAGNVFLGQTEAPLLVKPYVPLMTRSEMMALMTGGMATIAGSVLGAYVQFLGGSDPAEQAEFARLLLCASIMNAPAALVIAKLLVPETAEVNRSLEVPRDRIGANLLDAMAQGTTTGLKLALNVGAMLLVFLAMIAMADALLSGFLGALGPGQAGGILHGSEGFLNRAVREASGGVFDGLSFEALAGFCGAPVAWVIGVAPGELLQVGQLLGTKLVANEFVAYVELGELKEAGVLSDRAVFLATFALCGFANFGSIGIQLGGIGGLAPEQRPMIASLALRALLGGTMASLLTACIAGMFMA